MQIKQQVTIEATADRVWAFLVPPEKMKLWNEKLIEVEEVSTREISVGYRYQPTYRMKGKDNKLIAEIVIYEPPNHLKISCKELNVSDPKWFGRNITEEYVLTSKGNSTHLEQIITFDNTGIPWILRALIWFITSFGKPTGEPYLDKLKRLVETKV